MKRTIRIHITGAVASVALTVLTGSPFALFAASPALATPQDPAQQRLVDAKKGLAAVESRLPAADRALVRLVVLRVARDPLAASAIELELFDAVVKAGLTRRGDFLDDVAGPVNKVVTKAKEKKPLVRTLPRKVPGKKQPEAVVELQIEGRRKTIFEIPNAAGGYSAVKRADIVTKRIQQTMAADPNWYLGLEATQAKGLWVVKKSLGTAHIVTADPGFARMRGTSPQALASLVANEIRRTIGGPGLRSRSLAPTEEAASFRIEGDEAYAAGDAAAAEEAWKKAIASHKDYLLPHERLANLYKEQGKVDTAREMVDKALLLPDLTTEERTALITLRKTVHEVP